MSETSTLEKPQTQAVAQKRAKISVLIAARTDSKYLAKFMMALMCRTADFSNVEVLIMLNKNDKWNRDLQAFFMAFGLASKGTIQFFEEDYKLGRYGLDKYFNDLAERAVGDWLIYFCEDHYIEANGWDDAIRDFAADRELDPKKANIIIPKFDNVGAMNHVISRGLYNALGYMGRHAWIDSYWNDVGHLINREGLVHRMDDELFHDFTHDQPAHIIEGQTNSEVSQEIKETYPKPTSAEYHKIVGEDSKKIRDMIDRGVL